MAQRKKIFTRTVIAFIVLAIISTAVAVWRYGWERVIDESILYAVGFSISAVILSTIAYFVYKAVKK